jgi:flagellar basal-body rod modification protein FlgD
MGKDDFLKLLVAQLENQDPMNPSDPTEFTAQLAQFSQLEQLTIANTSLEGLATMSTEMERMTALGLIGQDIVAQTDSFHFDGEAVDLGYQLDGQADDIKLYVLNGTGSTLATLSATETTPGQYFVNWNGQGDSGSQLDPGDYSLVVRAVDEDDSLVEATPLIRGRVDTVDMSGVTAQLETRSGIFAMNKITKAGGI